MVEQDFGREVSIGILGAYVRSVEDRGLKVSAVAATDLAEAIRRRRIELSRLMVSEGQGATETRDKTPEAGSSEKRV